MIVSRASLSIWGLVLLALLSSCDSQSQASSSYQKELEATAKSALGDRLAKAQEPTRVASPAKKPETLLQLPESAYGNTLAIEGGVVSLLTKTAAYRLVENEAPTKTPIDLGFGAVHTRASILYWSEGALMAQPRKGAKAHRLADLKKRPRQLVASEDRFAWLSRDEARIYTIQVLRGSKAEVIYKARGDVTSLTMLQDWVFFVEATRAGSWRIGGVPVGGGKPTFSPLHQGRTPSMLKASEHIYYYDLPSRTVRRVSPDLMTEKIMAEKIVCSPLSVSERVLCARVEGIFQISQLGAEPQVLSNEPLGLVTAIAASKTHVAWVNDSGRDKMSVRILALPE